MRHLKKKKQEHLTSKPLTKGTKEGSELYLAPETWIFVSQIFQSIFDKRIKRLSINQSNQVRKFLLENKPQ